MTNAVLNGAKKLNPHVNIPPGLYMMDPNDQTRGQLMDYKFNNLMGKNLNKIDPIKIRLSTTPGIYYIVDGRHRVAKAISEGKTEMNAIVV